jgi:hypothetical protein
MRASVLVITVGLCLIAWSKGAAAQQEDLLVGTWAAQDPATGQQDQLVITATTLQFGAGEPEIPYTTEGSGGTWLIYIGGPGNPPATFSFSDADNATLAIPGGPTIPVTRVAAAPAAAPAETAAGAAPPAPGPGEGESDGGMSIADEMARMAAPFGVATRYEPLNASLESLLAAGWKLNQAAGAAGGFTLLLTNGASNALCVLVPEQLGQAATALSDCRRLN